MEEVDQIILDQLNHIGCDLDGEIKNLNKIDNHDLTNAFIRCVRMIDEKQLQNCKFNENMNITDKYRIATDLANAIKRMGYKAEIGYQTFLYFNEKESRRLLLFLFDKLSKQEQEEPSKNVFKNLMNRVKKIEVDFSKVKEQRDDLKWQTNELEYLNYFMKNEQDNCLIPFENPSLFIEWNTMNLNLNSKLFSNFYQNSKLVLNKESIDLNHLNKYKANGRKIVDSHLSSKLSKELNIETNDRSDEQEIDKLNDYLKHLEQQLAINRNNLESKEIELKTKKDQLVKLNQSFNEKKLELDKVKYSDKSNEELKDGIDQMKHEIKEVNKKWQSFNLEYNESINELKEKKKSIINKFDELNDEIQFTRNQIQISHQKLKKIDESTIELEQNLKEEDNDLDRKFYTKRIFEIINNVKKQEQDIDNILINIRNLQREINQISGKVTRTYTVVEETLLKNSNLTDWSKKCYRLISKLDEIYDELINKIELCGQTRREKLRFEEILDNEKQNKIGMNLAKVTYDLEQLRKENNN